MSSWLVRLTCRRFSCGWDCHSGVKRQVIIVRRPGWCRQEAMPERQIRSGKPRREITQCSGLTRDYFCAVARQLSGLPRQCREMSDRVAERTFHTTSDADLPSQIGVKVIRYALLMRWSVVRWPKSGVIHDAHVVWVLFFLPADSNRHAE